MKINDKNLSAFAVSLNGIDREGWLVKRGEINKAFQKRWFVLKELAEDDGQFGFKIVFHGQGNRTYILVADSQDSMEQWMKALACASYDYIKLMVSELQRQLEEMEVNVPLSNEEDNASGHPVPPPRTRHNPFNRAHASGSHCRSHSIRSAPGRTDHDNYRQKITFRELHNIYSRRILQDFNEWKYQQRQLQQPLIQL
uniref:Sesquipedalian-1-like protein n=1 Tax=Triatoma infestans TaxID=30076 RepID=A0A161MAI4_TRIIF